MSGRVSGVRQTGAIQWGVATQTKPGEADSGDLEIVESFPGGVLVGAVDGLGHGREAAEVAHLAASTLAAHAGEPVASLVRRCHNTLLETRGVVMSLASFDSGASTLTWIGVGNVTAVLLGGGPPRHSRRESLLLRGGVVGFQLPPLSEDALAIAPGDTLLLATDGVRPDFTEGLGLGPPADLAERILARHLKGSDDALVLVARFMGSAE